MSNDGLFVFSCPRCRAQLFRRTSQALASAGRAYFAHETRSGNTCGFFRWASQISAKEVQHSLALMAAAEAREWACLQHRRQLEDVHIVQQQLRAVSDTYMDKTVRFVAAMLSAYELVALGCVNRRCRNTLLVAARHLSPEVCSVWKAVEKRIAEYLQSLRVACIARLESPAVRSAFGAAIRGHACVSRLRCVDVLKTVQIHLLCNVFAQYVGGPDHSAAHCPHCSVDTSRITTHRCVFFHHAGLYRGTINLAFPRVRPAEGNAIDLLSIEHLQAFEQWCEICCLCNGGWLTALDYDLSQHQRRLAKVRRFANWFVLNHISGEFMQQRVQRMIRSSRVESAFDDTNQ